MAEGDEQQAGEVTPEQVPEGLPRREPLLRPADGDDVLELDVDEQRLLASLSYVGVLVAVPLFLRKNDPFVYWHAKQGLVLLVAMIIALIALAWVEVVGSVLFVLLLVVDVIALVQALLGRQWKIPLVGQIAESIRV